MKLLILIIIIFCFGCEKKEPVKEVLNEPSISDILLLNNNLKNILGVQRETAIKQPGDTLSANEIWHVPNGMSIPNYMLKMSKEIERCKGNIIWMKEIRDGRAALIRYRGEQGIYPLTEIRIIDSLWLPNSSKLAVVLAAREQNKLLKNEPQILEQLNFTYNLLVPSSRPELLAAAKKTNANIIPWIPMESSEKMYQMEKNAQISIGISEKDLSKTLDEFAIKFNSGGFAGFYGEDFLVHNASVDKFLSLLKIKKLWFWDLSKRGVATITLGECAKKELKCRKNYLEAESQSQIVNALRTARINGSAILLFELSEKSVELLKDLPQTAEKQGTQLTVAKEVFE